jgi:hypothetical protein
MHINKFADLTRTEFDQKFKAKKGVRIPKTRPTQMKPHMLRSTGILPDSVDWKTAGKVSLPGD